MTKKGWPPAERERVPTGVAFQEMTFGRLTNGETASNRFRD
jgi:hypothetical protein